MRSDDTSTSTAPPAQARLTGWKEIAAYFGKGVRTVQRWEKDVGLPVHRIGTGAGETVYALVSELEGWQQSPARETNGHPALDGSDAGADGPLAASHGAAGTSQTAERAADSSRDHDSAAAVDSSVQPSLPLPGPARRRARWLTAAGAVIVTGAIATALYLWFGAARPAAQPAQWAVEGNKLIISDAAGRFLWAHTFEYPLTKISYAPLWYISPVNPYVTFHDIDGDGRFEVLFVHEPWSPASRGLFCFGHDGRVLFHVEPSYRVSFGSKLYAPPWRGAAVYVTGPAARPHDIWFVSTHLEEFPTVVEKLDAAGNVKGAYWGNGQVYSFSVGEVAGRRLALVGGVSNEFMGGSLAILDAENPSGAAPADSDHYRCADCPAGQPVSFVVFPRLDVTAAIGDHATVVSTFVDMAGQIAVNVFQSVGRDVASELHHAAITNYTLDSQFRVIAAELGTRVPLIHAEFERRKLLDHPFDAAREARSLFPVIRWTPSGFREIPGLEGGSSR